MKIYGKFYLSERVFYSFNRLYTLCRTRDISWFIKKQKQLKFATWKSLSKILPLKFECSVYCFNHLYRLFRTRDISVVTQSFQLHSSGWMGVSIQNIQFSLHVPVSSIAKVAIVLCYCSVFEKLIVSSKSLIEVLEKFFKCLETRTSSLETRSSKLETQCLILKNFEDRGWSFELRLSTYICLVLYLYRFLKYLWKIVQSFM